MKRKPFTVSTITLVIRYDEITLDGAASPEAPEIWAIRRAFAATQWWVVRGTPCRDSTFFRRLENAIRYVISLDWHYDVAPD
jgi:hypothetical protein